MWLLDTRTGARRRLLASKSSQAAELDLQSFDTPTFSLDGGYVYISARAWMTSPAVHQVAVANGRERFVIDGALWGVLRTGPRRGWLLVERHRLDPGHGSYNAFYVVRPDAKRVFLVPGSDADDDRFSILAWLRRKGWTVG